MHGPVPCKSPKLDQTNLNKLFFVNNPVELSEVQKWLVADLDKEFGCAVTTAHLSVLQERVRHVFPQAHGEWLSTMLQNCLDFIREGIFCG